MTMEPMESADWSKKLQEKLEWLHATLDENGGDEAPHYLRDVVRSFAGSVVSSVVAALDAIEELKASVDHVSTVTKLTEERTLFTFKDVTQAFTQLHRRDESLAEQSAVQYTELLARISAVRDERPPKPPARAIREDMQDCFERVVLASANRDISEEAARMLRKSRRYLKKAIGEIAAVDETDASPVLKEEARIEAERKAEKKKRRQEAEKDRDDVDEDDDEDEDDENEGRPGDAFAGGPIDFDDLDPNSPNEHDDDDDDEEDDADDED